jgi:alpha-galactosidase/6-phospho-beta-glucosidase family protein
MTSKIGRPKKYDFLDNPITKEEYNKKWYEANREKSIERYKENKDEMKKKYKENKEEMKKKSKDIQKKYRDSFRLLKIIYERYIIPNDIIEDVKKIFD